MSIKENKALIRRVYELINQGDLNAYFDRCAPGYVEHLTDRNISLEQSKQSHAKSGTDIADLNVTINDMVAEGDKVSVLVTHRATHKGTGKKLEMTNANIFRIVKGRIMECWNVMDIRAAQQPGMIPKQ